MKRETEIDRGRERDVEKENTERKKKKRSPL